MPAVNQTLEATTSVLGMRQRSRVVTQLNAQVDFTQWLPDLPGKVLNFGVSVGCLEGVWKVSGGCLGDSGYCLGGYNAKTIDKFRMGIVLIS